MDISNQDSSAISSESQMRQKNFPGVSLGQYNDYLDEHIQRLAEQSAYLQENTNFHTKKLPKIFTVSQILHDPLILSHIKPECGSLGQFITDTSIFNGKDLTSQKKRRNDQTTTEQQTQEKKLRKKYKLKKHEQLQKIFTNINSSELEKSVASRMLIQGIFREQFGSSLPKFENQNCQNQSKLKSKNSLININNIDDIFKKVMEKQKEKSQYECSSALNKSLSKFKYRGNQYANYSENKNVSFYEDQRNIKHSSSNSRFQKIGNLNYSLHPHRSSNDGLLISSSQKIFDPKNQQNSITSKNIPLLQQSKIQITTFNQLCSQQYVIQKQQKIQQIKYKYPSLRSLRILPQSRQFNQLLQKYHQQCRVKEEQENMIAMNVNKNRTIKSFDLKTDNLIKKSIDTFIGSKSQEFTFQVFPQCNKQTSQDNIINDEQSEFSNMKASPIIKIIKATIKPQVILYIVSNFDLSKLKSLHIKSSSISDESLAFLMQCISEMCSKSLKSIKLEYLKPLQNRNQARSKQKHIIEKNIFSESIKKIFESSFIKQISQVNLIGLELSSKDFCTICLGVAVNQSIQVLNFSQNLIDQTICRTLEMIVKHTSSLDKIILNGNFVEKFHLRRFMDTSKVKIIL